MLLEEIGAFEQCMDQTAHRDHTERVPRAAGFLCLGLINHQLLFLLSYQQAQLATIPLRLLSLAQDSYQCILPYTRDAFFFV